MTWLCLQQAGAQYFGRNKVNYNRLHFEVLTSPHFALYHYLEDTAARDRFMQSTEHWYRLHQAVLSDTFKQENPIILYNNHAHFQQTRAISGLVGVGTGGVTEALKNRVIMPVMEANAQTDHVLGHELVHAFQYHLIFDTLSINALNNLPLWMVEGMAEYMSIGPRDAHTAIWLRSAVASNQLPTLKDLTSRPDLYFPYRWGQAFWAFVTGIWGDAAIKRLFIETGRSGYQAALKKVLGLNEKEFSERWQQSLRNAYAPLQAGTTAPVGKVLVSKENGGELNVIPSLSPDGSRLAFWTEKNLFSVDLMIADAQTGRIIRKVSSSTFASHIDEYSSFESSVAWSPDSRQLAFVAFAKGRNRLLIANAENGKIVKQLDVPGVPAISNPAWSPDGSTIVMTGLVDGQSDLFSYHLQTGVVKQLTNDRYANLQPSFSASGNYLVFATDALSLGILTVQHRYAHNLALYHFPSGQVTQLSFFPEANNLNPVFSDDSTIYFLSDRDGFRNLYRYHLATQRLQQLTQIFTGITGITLFAPAITVAPQASRMMYTVYNNDEYHIWSAAETDFKPKEINADDVAPNAALLPPHNQVATSGIMQSLSNNNISLLPAGSLSEGEYKPRFQLDYIGNSGVGISTGSGYGTGVAGGINGIFSDMLGNNQLYGAFALNGEIYDVGGQFAYLNQKRRINWGAGLSHIPYLSGAEHLSLDTLTRDDGRKLPVVNYATDLLRTFEDQLSFFAAYPFSQVRRLEAGALFARYYYRMDRYASYYSYTDVENPATYSYVQSQKTRQPTPEGFNIGQGYLALVGDNASFGVASPLVGHRFRFEASQYVGAINLSTLTGDYRRYFRLSPFTLATRNMYLARFGKDAESNILPPLYVGHPTLVRGYEALRFAESNERNGIAINDLIGSRIFVSNLELRLPFIGPERLSIISSRFLFTEFNLFTDGGIAWGQLEQNPNSDNKGTPVERNATFIISSGLSARINLFGYLVIEPYYAVPWQNGGFRNGAFGINFIPGW